MDVKRWSAKRRATAVLATMGVLGGVGGVAYAESQNSAAGVALTPGGVAAPRVDPAYPTNVEGRSFGSLDRANSPADEPDLILASATNGKQGYVKKTELDAATGANAANPDESLAFQKRMDAAAAAGEVFYIPVYAVDGVTVIGQFLITPSSSVAAKP